MAATPVEEANRRLVTVSCSVSQRSYAAPWELAASATEEQPGLRVERPYVLTFASALAVDAECTAEAPGGPFLPAEVVRYDRRLDVVVLRVDDDAFWEGLEAVNRSGVLPLGAHATAVTAGSTTMMADVAVSAFLPMWSPVGTPRITSAMSPPPRWPGFVFKGDAFAGLLAGGKLVPEWTVGPWDAPGPVAAPSLGLSVTSSENPAFRKRYSIPEDSGVLIRFASPAWKGDAQSGDALVAVGGQRVGHDGTVSVPELGTRLPATIAALASPTAPNFTISHEGKEVEVAAKPTSSVGQNPVMGKASYLVVGGMVFAPLTSGLVDELSGDWLLRLPDELRAVVQMQPVVLANVLPHPVNAFLPTDTVRIVRSCNGKEAHSLEQLLTLVKEEESDYLACNFLSLSTSDKAIGVAPGSEPSFPDWVWDTKELKKAGPEILDQYRLPASMSMDLCSVGAMDELTAAACEAEKNGAEEKAKAEKKADTKEADSKEADSKAESKADSKADEKAERSLLRGQSRGFGRSLVAVKRATDTVTPPKAVAWGGHEHKQQRRVEDTEVEPNTEPLHAAPEQDFSLEATLRERIRLNATKEKGALSDEVFGAFDDSEDGDVVTASNLEQALRVIGSLSSEQLAATESMFPEEEGKARKMPPNRESAAIPLSHVVKIYTTSQRRSFLVPWRFSSKVKSTGSGILVHAEDFGLPAGGRYLLTNAHVAGGHQSVMVQRQDYSKKVRAKVLVVAPDVDIAVLQVDDDALWASVGKLSVAAANVPAANSRVRVAGYPLGGNAVSVTTGVVSRVIGMEYEFSQPRGWVNSPSSVVAVQVDAAINPGNSGGPVFNEDGAFVGLAFAGMTGADNMGFVIPAEVVQARLPALLAGSVSTKSRRRDAGTYGGIADFGVKYRRVENAAMRRYMELDHGGVIVTSVAPLGPLAGKIAPGDALLAVDSQIVAGDGTVLVPGSTMEGDVRFPFDSLVTAKGDGDLTTLLVRRVDEEMTSLLAARGEQKQVKVADTKVEKKAADAKVEEKAADTKVEKKAATSDKESDAKVAASDAITSAKAEVVDTKFKLLHAMSEARKAKKGRKVVTALVRTESPKSEELQVKFVPLPPRVPRYDTDPSYVVVGGLVFSKFTVPLYNAFSQYKGPVPSPTERTLDTWKRMVDGDVVVLVDSLTSEVNEHYNFPRMSILTTLNGKPVTSLEQLVELLPSAFESEFLEFSFDNSGFASLVLDSKLAANDAALLQEYAVPCPVSPDLVDVFCKGNADGKLSHWSGCEK